MSTSALAEVPAALDRVYVSLGTYLADSDADARVDGADGRIGSDVNFEDDFGLTNNRLVGRGRLGFLIGDSQGIELDGYRFHRSARKTLDRRIDYDGSTFNVAADVYGKLDMDLASVAWRWWVPAGDRDVWGLGIGAAYYRVAGAVTGEASVNDRTEIVRLRESVSAWAPRLELGWRHAFSDTTRVYADVSGVKKNGGTVAGHIYNLSLGVEYFPWQHLGFGFEYGAQRIHVEANQRRFDGVLNVDLSGPSLFLKARY